MVRVVKKFADMLVLRHIPAMHSLIIQTGLMIGLFTSTLAAETLKLDSPRLGHTFADDEAIEMRVSGISGPVSWNLAEEDGIHTASGTVTAVPAGTLIPLKVPHRGLYTLKVSASGQTQSSRFAVIYPSGAGASVRSGLFFIPFKDQKDADLMYRIGARSIRLQMFYGIYPHTRPKDPADLKSGSIDFSNPRGQFEKLIAAGFSAENIYIGTDTLWPALSAGGVPSAGPVDLAHWKWVFKKTLLAFPDVTHWEIWNETDFYRFWTGGDQYLVDVIHAAYDCIKELEHDGQLTKPGSRKILISGFTGNLEGPTMFRRLVRNKTDATGKALERPLTKFDVLTFHYTASHHYRVKEHKKVLEDYGLVKPFWNTEENDPAPAGNDVEDVARSFKFVYTQADDGDPDTVLFQGPEKLPTKAVCAFRTHSYFTANTDGPITYSNGNLPNNDNVVNFSGVRVARYPRSSGGPLHVLWQNDPNLRAASAVLSATVTDGVPRITVTDFYGRAREIAVKDGAVEIPFNPQPYLFDSTRKYYITGTTTLTPTGIRYINDDNHLVVEAEDAILSGGYGGWGALGFSKNLSARAKEGADTPTASFPFQVPAAGSWDVILICESLSSYDSPQSYLSSFRWRVDDGGWNEVARGAKPPADLDYGRRAGSMAGPCGYKLGTHQFAKAGSHTVTLELTSPAPVPGKSHRLSLDAMALRRK